MSSLSCPLFRPGLCPHDGLENISSCFFSSPVFTGLLGTSFFRIAIKFEIWPAKNISCINVWFYSKSVLKKKRGREVYAVDPTIVWNIYSYDTGVGQHERSSNNWFTGPVFFFWANPLWPKSNVPKPTRALTFSQVYHKLDIRILNSIWNKSGPETEDAGMRPTVVLNQSHALKKV